MNLLYLLVICIGLIVGSFINSLVYRLHAKKSLFIKRSFCPKCKKSIKWYDNIPLVSFILLKGKCRFCKSHISLQYPLVELSTAVLFLLVFIYQLAIVDFNIPALGTLDLLFIFRNWIFTAILMVIFIYDYKHYMILDKVSLPAIAVVFIFNLFIIFYQQSFNFNLSDIWGPVSKLLLAALLAGGFFFLQFIISRGRWIGGGDIRLGILMGLMLGWPNVVVALVFGYIIGSLIGLSLIALKKKSMQSQLPLGTFMAVTTFIALLWGSQIVAWYLY